MSVHNFTITIKTTDNVIQICQKLIDIDSFEDTEVTTGDKGVNIATLEYSVEAKTIHDAFLYAVAELIYLKYEIVGNYTYD